MCYLLINVGDKASTKVFIQHLFVHEESRVYTHIG